MLETLIRNRTRMSGGALGALLVTLMLTLPFAAALATGANANDITVAEGTVTTVTHSLRVGELDVLGTLKMDGPGTWTIEALDVHVGPHGIIEGLRGADGASATGADATGAPGAAGGSVLIFTNSPVVAEGGVIAAGAGGTGGNAAGAGLVVGGAGGEGGSATM